MADKSENFWLVQSSDESSEFWNRVALAGETEANVALVDLNGQIRSYYNLSESDQLRQLVEHTAFLLPVEEMAKPIIQRASEK